MDTTYSSERRQTKGTYAFVSLGCPKNLVDSERMLGLLQLDGYQLVNDPEDTDFVIVMFSFHVYVCANFGVRIARFR